MLGASAALGRRASAAQGGCARARLLIGDGALLAGKATLLRRCQLLFIQEYTGVEAERGEREGALRECL
jgi:hypothetical protein